MAAAGRDVTGEGLLRGVFFAVLVSVVALEAVRFNVVQRPLPLASAYQSADPVVAAVGRDVIRVSDAIAHAAFVGESDVKNVRALIARGTVDEAADHLALAQAARERGLDQAVEIRATIALAERQILAEAYLETIAAEAVTEEAIRRRYEEERQSLAGRSALRLSRIVVADRAVAESLRARLPQASFGKLARERSEDELTDQNGSLGEVTLAELPVEVADAVGELAVGDVTEPFEAYGGWTLVKVEARRTQRMRSFAERRDEIAAQLREEALRGALQNARAESPVRLRTAEAIRAEGERGGRIATVRR